MGRRRAFSPSLVLSLLLIAGCSAPPSHKPYRQGAKVNIAHLIQNPVAYKGKTITLTLTIAEGSAPGEALSLRQHINREVKFTGKGLKGEALFVVIRIPETISIPEAVTGDEVFVTFVCSGDLRRGNEAKAIEKR
jgi:hypothetical protein